MDSVTENTLQLCCLDLADLRLGIDVLSVQEVIKDRPLTAVPRAVDTVKGLLNLRGQILTAIDLRRRFNLPKAEEELPSKRLVIVNTDTVNVALLVDAVGDVIDVTSDTFEEPTGKIPEAIKPFILGVHNLGGRILHVIDANAISKL